MFSIGVKFMIEKREGHGEDSNPLFIIKDGFYAVGVFDGMGGSGAAICTSEYGDNHTKAYVASRIVHDAISAYIENLEDTRDINPKSLSSVVAKRLEQEKTDFPTRATGLRSKLVRDYPTTLAITTAYENKDKSYAINSYWAGDSRNYLWTTEGFYQISKDDLDSELDPLENLRNDGALSNCICADKSFVINNKTINVKGKFIILSATDGCFNYFATPMHFQEVLLTGLKLSDTVEDWEGFCKEKFSAVTGDDVSMSLLAIGFVDFNDLKATFAQSTIVGIEQIYTAQEAISNIKSDLEAAKKMLETLIQDGWGEYRKSYMKYLNGDIDAGTSNIEVDTLVGKESRPITESKDTEKPESVEGGVLGTTTNEEEQTDSLKENVVAQKDIVLTTTVSPIAVSSSIDEDATKSIDSDSSLPDDNVEKNEGNKKSSFLGCLFRK